MGKSRERRERGGGRNRQGGRVRGMGWRRKGSYQRKDSFLQTLGLRSCRADFSRLGPLETSQTCHCGQDYFPKVPDSMLLWPCCSLTSNPGQIPNFSERKSSLHSGLGGWDEMRRLKGICNPLFKGCLVAEACHSSVDVVV